MNKRRINQHRKRAQARKSRLIKALRSSPEFKRRVSAFAVGEAVADSFELKSAAGRIGLHALLQNLAAKGMEFANSNNHNDTI